jgi:hypothetical protein
MKVSQRGFLNMTFTTTKAKSEWFFVSIIGQRTYTSALGYAKTMAA